MYTAQCIETSILKALDALLRPSTREDIVKATQGIYSRESITAHATVLVYRGAISAQKIGAHTVYRRRTHVDSAVNPVRST
jgi:hypothetical protein